MNITTKVIVAVFILIIGCILGPLFKKGIIKMSESAPSLGALTFIGSCVSILTILIAAVIALSYLGINMNVIIGTMSAIGLGISLSLKDSMANVAGGIQILLTHPFVLQDYIQIEKKEGFVKRIEMMYTIIETFDGSQVVIPNAQVVTDTLVNVTREKIRAIYISFDVSSTQDFGFIKAFCLKAAKECTYVLDDPATNVYMEKVDTSRYSVGLYAWCHQEEYFKGLYDLNERIQKYRLEQGVQGPIQSISLK